MAYVKTYITNLIKCKYINKNNSKDLWRMLEFKYMKYNGPENQIDGLNV